MTLKSFPFQINKLSQWTIKFSFIGFVDLGLNCKCILMEENNLAAKCLMICKHFWESNTHKPHLLIHKAMLSWKFLTNYI